MKEILSSTSQILLLFLLGLPLLSFIIGLLIPEKLKSLIAIGSTFIHVVGAVIAFILFYNTWNGDPIHYTLSWFGTENFQFQISLLFNNLSVLISVTVMVIAMLVHVYSIAYMQNEPGIKRYFGMLGLFTFSMLLIVISGNLLLMYIGWELVGFASYMLIGFWREKPAAAKAASKAFIMNRIGDAGFLIALLIIWTKAGSFELLDLTPFQFEHSWQLALSLCLFAGVMGKSAQFPLLTWLPDAMEGPTPVSALIHAATMVAAGIFLLARIFFLLDPLALQIIMITGLISSLMAALAAWQQNDIKKTLAYSTISQLGLMVTAIGLGNFSIAIFHLFTHAFFKAGLFLSAGAIIQSNKKAAKALSIEIDPQDINNMGGLRKLMPLTFLSFLISGASLAGLPFFSGFVSKEAIFNLALYQELYFVLDILFIISLITVLYITKLTLKIFFGDNITEKLHKNFVQFVKEPSYLILVPTLLLAIASMWWIAGLHPFSYQQWLLNGLGDVNLPNSMLLSLSSVGWVVMGIGLAYFMYVKNTHINTRLSGMLKNNFYLDKIYQVTAIQPVLAFAGLSNLIDKRFIDRFLHGLAYLQVGIAELAGWFDRNIIDGAVNLSAFIAAQTGILIRSTGAGKIQSYIAISMLVLVIFLLWIMFK